MPFPPALPAPILRRRANCWQRAVKPYRKFLYRHRLHRQHLPRGAGALRHGAAQPRQRAARLGQDSRLFLSRQHDSRLQPHPSERHGGGRPLRHLFPPRSRTPAHGGSTARYAQPFLPRRGRGARRLLRRVPQRLRHPRGTHRHGAVRHTAVRLSERQESHRAARLGQGDELGPHRRLLPRSLRQAEHTRHEGFRRVGAGAARVFPNPLFPPLYAHGSRQRACHDRRAAHGDGNQGAV